MSWKKYYEFKDSFYPIENFEIKGKNGASLVFFSGNAYKNERIMDYFLRDSAYQEAYKQQKEKNLSGEETSNEENVCKTFEAKAHIWLCPEEKWISFAVSPTCKNNGYGRAIYDNYIPILEKLGIPNPEQYELRISGCPNHDFLKKMKTEKLVSKASGEPNKEKASQLLTEFSQYPNSMQLRDLNRIIQYAIDSNIPITEITEAINNNGLNVSYIISDRWTYV